MIHVVYIHREQVNVLTMTWCFKLDTLMFHAWQQRGSKSRLKNFQWNQFIKIESWEWVKLRHLRHSKCHSVQWILYRGADKSLARPGRKQATATEDFVSYILFVIILGGILVQFIYIYIYIYIYNKTNIERNILTIKQNTSGSRSG